MSAFHSASGVSGRIARAGQRGLTLAEMMVTMGVFSMMVLGLVSAHIFGLKRDQLVQSKLGASEQSRRGFNQLAADVRGAKKWAVGNGTRTSFAPIANNSLQQGTALQLNLTSNTNNYIRYYFEGNNSRLCRVKSGESGYKVIAQDLTNTLYFAAEDFKGSNQTTLTYKGVVRVQLQFRQYQYPLTKVGPGYYYDSYTLQFRLTPHAPDGL
jgi:prepilin-type N-terminal cleavage/methylation domain-containing protein